MRRRQYLAAASSVLVAGCTDIWAKGGYETPSGTEPLSGSFSTPSDDAWWSVEVDPGSALSTVDDVYVYSEAGLDRFSSDGTHRWHVDTEDEVSWLISDGATLYYKLGPRWGQSLMARDVATGDELWTYDTTGGTLAASESAVVVGETSHDGGGRVRAIDAESGEDRWMNGLWPQSTAIFTHNLCLVPHYTMVKSERKNSVSALDAATGERQWQYSHDEADDNESLQVVGDTAYLLTTFGVAAYDLPGGEERWRRSLDLRQQAMAAAAPGAGRTDTIVAGSRDGTLLGLDAVTGEWDWGLDLGGFLVRIPIIARWEETVAVVGDGVLYGFDVASGDEQWRQDLSTDSSGGIRAVIDGTLFLVTSSEENERHVQTYDVESGRRGWQRPLNREFVDDGVVADRYVGLTEAGDLYGFSTD